MGPNTTRAMMKMVSHSVNILLTNEQAETSLERCGSGLRDGVVLLP